MYLPGYCTELTLDLGTLAHLDTCALDSTYCVHGQVQYVEVRRGVYQGGLPTSTLYIGSHEAYMTLHSPI